MQTVWPLLYGHSYMGVCFETEKYPKSPLRKYLGIENYFHFGGAVSLVSELRHILLDKNLCDIIKKESDNSPNTVVLLFHKGRIRFFSQRASLSSLLLVTRCVWL